MKTMSAKKSWDAVIIGGGIMGCGTAWELARAGLRVVVLERSVPGAEASSAAAGILGAQIESHHDGPLFDLALRSRARYPEWAAALFAATGIDIEHRRSGVVRVEFDRKTFAALKKERAFQRKKGCRIETLGTDELRVELPMLNPDAHGALRFPEDARVDPPKLLRALRIAAERAGVVFRSGTLVRHVLVKKQRCQGVALDDGSAVSGGQVVVAAGSWSSLVEGVPMPKGGVVPARGQIIELTLPAPLFEPAIFGPRCYLVPRDDGRILIGSTLEFVGYRREVTASAVRDLLDAALTLVPELGKANFSQAWSNFRPYTRDELPLIGEAGISGLLLATGHYRNGILLAPVTAEIIRALALGEPAPVPLTLLSPKRRGRASSERAHPDSQRNDKVRAR
jgi:glycine oxidase